MGMLFGGYLSRENDVFLIDIDRARVDAVNRRGVLIKEPDGRTVAAKPRAAATAEGLECMDLVILFVKARHSRSALEATRCIIGPDTCVLSLQNGAGHEAVLGDFVRDENVVIGTTQHNSSVIEPGVVYHGGGGRTYIGPLHGDGNELKAFAETFNRCGLETEIVADIKPKIWEKLFLNASASALTAILRTRLGFVAENRHAWSLAERLICEAVAVARAEGMEFEERNILDEVRSVLEKAKDGYTSIYADICNGRKTEVDAISGAIVRAGMRGHVPTPCHEFVVGLIHALEDNPNDRERMG
jgi:2-dehydropantoate 2-reductase